jgi:hypothetical protein
MEKAVLWLLLILAASPLGCNGDPDIVSGLIDFRRLREIFSQLTTE